MEREQYKIKLGINYTVPDSLAKLEQLKEHYVKINPDFDKIYKLIKDFQIDVKSPRF